MKKKKFEYDGPRIAHIYDDLSLGEIVGLLAYVVAMIAIFLAMFGVCYLLKWLVTGKVPI